MHYDLPQLPYAYTALEPFIDAQTMEIHHSKHHQAYVTNLNAALDKHPDFAELTLDDLLGSLTGLPEEIRTEVQNNGGGHHNHTFFWNIMTPDKTKPSEALANKLSEQFGTLESFQEQFTKAAIARFGSGWAWLVLNSTTLEIMSTANQDTPLSAGLVPLLGLDVWEHAYYLKYQNKRADYIANWWNVVNWEQVEKHLQNANGI